MKVREALLVIIPAPIGTVAGVFVASLQAHRQREAQYDIDLRKERIPAYQKLWKCLEPFAYYSLPGPVTVGKLRDIPTEMPSWYYKSGGLVLSPEARDVYFRLQEGSTVV